MKRFNKILSAVLRPIRENMLFFLFLYLLGILTMMVEVWALNFKIQRFNFLSWIFDLYLLCFLLSILPNKIRKWIRILLCFILYFLSIINSFCVHYFYAKIGTEILNVVLETNPRESSEFIDKYINLEIIYSGIGLILILLLIHLIFAFSLNRFKKWISSQWAFLLPTYKILFKSATALAVLTSFLICTHSRIQLIQLMMARKAEDVDTLTSNFSENTPFNNLLFSIKMRQLANQGLNVLTEAQEKTTIDSCSYNSNHIVLIIGESYIKDHAQLYGYSKETTPRQIKRQLKTEHGCLVAFTDVISPSNLTSIVFKNTFSLHSI